MTAGALAYLGPDGSFSHAAALGAAARLVSASGDAPALVPLATVTDVYAAVAAGRAPGADDAAAPAPVATGVVAIESTVEGYVVASLDALVAAQDVVAVDELALDISFDAFVRPDATQATEITAHPHGLAQCARYIATTGLVPVPATSNAAACRDVLPHQVALGPAVCGELYGLRRVAAAVQDFSGARTRFLVLSRRGDAAASVAARRDEAADAAGSGAASGSAWRTMLAITPHEIGPGVLARITVAFGERGVNMSSLITRPLKAQEGTYVFVVTLDGAPWQPHVRALLEQLLAAGDSLKTLGVFPDRTGPDAGFDTSRVPAGSVRGDADAATTDLALLW